jgi:hypothetical protein
VIRALSTLAFLLAMVPAAAAAAPACEFKLGFKALHDQIPDAVGDCAENERHNARNGNTEQRTSAHHGKGGLLAWRKADNWTAFTDGHWTWVAGPNGVQRRLNSGPLFDWEAPAPAQESAAPQIEPPSGRPSAAPRTAAPASARWARHDDPEKRFDYPVGWKPVTSGRTNAYVSPGGEAMITYYAPFKMGRDARAADFLGRTISAIAASDQFELGPHESGTLNGFPAEMQAYVVKGEVPLIAIIVAVQRGSYVHMFNVGGTPGGWERYESEIEHVLGSYVPKTE